MSFKVQAAVEASGLPRREKTVAKVLASYADETGARIWPSPARVAGEAGYSERSVQLALLTLLRAGILEITKDHGRYRSREYRLIAQRLPPGRLSCTG